MRKSGGKVEKKPAGTNKFKGFKIAPPTTSTVGKQRATGFEIDMAQPQQQHEIPLETLDDESETEEKAIPAKKNVEWMERRKRRGAQDVESKQWDVREQRAFKTDVGELDDVDEDAYERVAVEDFGLMMLRGMGLKDADDKRDEHNDNEMRPSLLGLGAKPRPEDTLPQKKKQAKRY